MKKTKTEKYDSKKKENKTLEKKYLSQESLQEEYERYMELKYHEVYAQQKPISISTNTTPSNVSKHQAYYESRTPLNSNIVNQKPNHFLFPTLGSENTLSSKNPPLTPLENKNKPISPINNTTRSPNINLKPSTTHHIHKGKLNKEQTPNTENQNTFELNTASNINKYGENCNDRIGSRTFDSHTPKGIGNASASNTHNPTFTLTTFKNKQNIVSASSQNEKNRIFRSDNMRPPPFQVYPSNCVHSKGSVFNKKYSSNSQTQETPNLQEYFKPKIIKSCTTALPPQNVNGNNASSNQSHGTFERRVCRHQTFHPNPSLIPPSNHLLNKVPVKPQFTTNQSHINPPLDSVFQENHSIKSNSKQKIRKNTDNDQALTQETNQNAISFSLRNKQNQNKNKKASIKKSTTKQIFADLEEKLREKAKMLGLPDATFANIEQDHPKSRERVKIGILRSESDFGKDIKEKVRESGDDTRDTEKEVIKYKISDQNIRNKTPNRDIFLRNLERINFELKKRVTGDRTKEIQTKLKENSSESNSKQSKETGECIVNAEGVAEKSGRAVDKRVCELKEELKGNTECSFNSEQFEELEEADKDTDSLDQINNIYFMNKKNSMCQMNMPSFHRISPKSSSFKTDPPTQQTINSERLKDCSHPIAPPSMNTKNTLNPNIPTQSTQKSTFKPQRISKTENTPDKTTIANITNITHQINTMNAINAINAITKINAINEKAKMHPYTNTLNPKKTQNSKLKSHNYTHHTNLNHNINNLINNNGKNKDHISLKDFKQKKEINEINENMHEIKSPKCQYYNIMNNMLKLNAQTSVGANMVLDRQSSSKSFYAKQIKGSDNVRNPFLINQNAICEDDIKQMNGINYKEVSSFISFNSVPSLGSINGLSPIRQIRQSLIQNKQHKTNSSASPSNFKLKANTVDFNNKFGDCNDDDFKEEIVAGEFEDLDQTQILYTEEYPNISEDKRIQITKRTKFNHPKNLPLKRQTINSGMLSKLLGSSQIKCHCKMDKELPCCVNAKKWITLVYKQRGFDFDFESSAKLYYDLLKIEDDESETHNQIKRDLGRTFPKSKFYFEKGDGQMQLERILLAFSKYDPQIGYVQGMNFIAGSLLYHASEEIAFWLFVSLVEDYELRDIYLPGIPGLYKHCQLIHLLLFEHNPIIYRHFSEHKIMVEMFATDWIFTLFSSIIPIDYMQYFYDKYFVEGWIFFYKFVLGMIKVFEVDILRANEMGDIIHPMKNAKTPYPVYKFLSKVPLLQKYSNHKFWKDQVKNANRFNLNDGYINVLLSNFDFENLRFNCPPNKQTYSK